MIRGSADLFQISLDFFGRFGIIERDVVQSDDRIHRRTDLMAHARKERRLRFIGLFRLCKRFTQDLLPGQRFAHFRINDRQTQPDLIHSSLLRVIAPAKSICDPDHFIVFIPVPLYQIPVGKDLFFFQSLPDTLRIDKIQESVPELLCHKSFGITDEGFLIREIFTFLELFFIIRIRPVTDGDIFRQIHMIDTAVICCHGGDHLIQLRTVLFFIQKLLLQHKTLLHLFLFDFVRRFGSLLLQPQLRISPALADNEQEHGQQCDDRQN